MIIAWYTIQLQEFRMINNNHKFNAFEFECVSKQRSIRTWQQRQQRMATGFSHLWAHLICVFCSFSFCLFLNWIFIFYAAQMKTFICIFLKKPNAHTHHTAADCRLISNWITCTTVVRGWRRSGDFCYHLSSAWISVEIILNLICSMRVDRCVMEFVPFDIFSTRTTHGTYTQSMLMICRPSGRFTPFFQTIFVRYALPFFIINCDTFHSQICSFWFVLCTQHTWMVENELRNCIADGGLFTTFTTFYQCTIQSALLIYVFSIYVMFSQFNFLFCFCFCSYRHLFIGINFTDSSLFSALSLSAFARCHPSRWRWSNTEHDSWLTCTKLS